MIIMLIINNDIMHIYNKIIINSIYKIIIEINNIYL